MTKLYSHGDCLGKGSASDEVPKVPERILKRAYKVVLEREEMTPEMLKEEAVRGLVARTATILSSPLEAAEIKEVLPDEMYRALRDDVFLFSGFKTYHQLKEAAVSLLDGSGKLKSFQRFYDDTLAVREKYNRNWLQAEYNQAVASSQMAAKWHEYSQDAELYDLEYVTVGDAKVRPDHQALGGIILPMDSPFWTEAYPPNGWNCRCSVIRVPKGMKPTSNASQAMGVFKEATAGKDEIFRFNPGIKGEMFPEKHPYYGKNGYKHCLNPKLAGGRKSEECSVRGNVTESHKIQKKIDRNSLNRRVLDAFSKKYPPVGNSPRFVNSSNLKTGVFMASNKSVIHCLRYVFCEEAGQALKKALLKPEMLEHDHSLPLGATKGGSKEDIENIQKKEIRGVTGYNYYLYSYRRVKYQIAMEVRSEGGRVYEVFYGFTTKKED